MTNRGGRLWLALAVALAWAPGAGALTIRPMSDTNLVRSSDLVVIGTVEAVRSGEWRGRIVTWVDVRVERRVKGRSEGDVIRLTEAGGRVGDRRLVIPGAPTYEPGERVVLFARTFGDGLLRTNAMTLGKFTVREAPGGAAEARRGAPVERAEPLDTLERRLRSLVGDEAGRPVPNGFVGDQSSRATAAPFVIGLSDGQGGLLRGRWIEAECGVPVEYSLGNLDPLLGDAGTRTAVDAALDAWTDPPTGSISLTLGPDLPIASQEFLWANTIVFEDPFDEILTDLVGCEGVLAVGGFAAENAGNLFERIVQGFIVMNVGVSACIDAAGVAETLAHEVGHSIGFGHSSEDPFETNAVLVDALMYFAIHDDGRGAQLGADDLAGLATLYPAIPPSDPITDGLAQLACLYDLGPLGAGCGVDAAIAAANGLRLRLPAAPVRKYRKGARLARKAEAAATTKKQTKLVTKSRKQALKASGKAGRLFDRGKWTPGCFDDIDDATGRVLDAADALLLLLTPGV